MYMLADDLRRRVTYRVGLTGYELLAAGRNIGYHRSVSAGQVREAIPGIGGRSRGFRYFECQVDDARLTIEVARAAQAVGARLANHARQPNAWPSESSRTAAGRKPGSVSQNPQAYRALPRSRPTRLSPAARATTAPPRPASAMLTKYLIARAQRAAGDPPPGPARGRMGPGHAGLAPCGADDLAARPAGGVAAQRLSARLIRARLIRRIQMPIPGSARAGCVTSH
jgi:hypothetical protein